MNWWFEDVAVNKWVELNHGNKDGHLRILFVKTLKPTFPPQAPPRVWTWINRFKASSAPCVSFMTRILYDYLLPQINALKALTIVIKKSNTSRSSKYINDVVRSQLSPKTPSWCLLPISSSRKHFEQSLYSIICDPRTITCVASCSSPRHVLLTHCILRVSWWRCGSIYRSSTRAVR